MPIKINFSLHIAESKSVKKFSGFANVRITTKQFDTVVQVCNIKMTAKLLL